jgi:hypothetical protein
MRIITWHNLKVFSDPRPQDFAHGIEYSRIRDGACPIPYIYYNIFACE